MTSTLAKYAIRIVIVMIGGPLFVGCSAGGAELGRACTTSPDCASGLQCFADQCVPVCQRDHDCGDGYTCTDSGSCEVVDSALGQACQRERDCGPSHTCRPAPDQPSQTQCLEETSGKELFAGCTTTTDCGQGSCLLGHCVEHCQVDADCTQDGSACAQVPFIALTNLANDNDNDNDNEMSGDYRVCLPSTGSFVYRLPPAHEHRIPVPSHAKSVSMTFTHPPAPSVAWTGTSRIVAPSGTVLHARGSDDASQPNVETAQVRYQPGRFASTVILPSGCATNVACLEPSNLLELGHYHVRTGLYDASDHPLSGMPRTTVVYKFGDGRTLDLNLYFLNLDDHPCAFSSLSAETAASAQGEFQTEFIARIRQIFAKAAITIGDLRFRDIDNDEFAHLHEGDLPRLARLADPALSGLNLFFVRSMSPVGIQAITSANPGPPTGFDGNPSGVAVALDTHCYRDWHQLARSTAHNIARQMGLFRSLEPDTGRADPVADGEPTEDNLMYPVYTVEEPAVLTPAQQRILRLYPGLRK